MVALSKFPASDDGDRGLYVRPSYPPRSVAASGLPGCMPLLVGVLADKRGQNVNYGCLVSRGVAGNTLKRVYASNPHVQFVGT